MLLTQAEYLEVKATLRPYFILVGVGSYIFGLCVGAVSCYLFLYGFGRLR